MGMSTSTCQLTDTLSTRGAGSEFSSDPGNECFCLILCTSSGLLSSHFQNPPSFVHVAPEFSLGFIFTSSHLGPVLTTTSWVSFYPDQHVAGTDKLFIYLCIGKVASHALYSSTRSTFNVLPSFPRPA